MCHQTVGVEWCIISIPVTAFIVVITAVIVVITITEKLL